MMKNKRIWAYLAVVVVLTGVVLLPKKKSAVEGNMGAIMRLSEEIRRDYQMKYDYRGLSVEGVDEALLTNGYGKKVLVGSGFDGQAVMFGARVFDVVYKDLSRAQCVEMLRAKMDKEDVLGLLEVLVQNETGVIEFAWDGVNRLPIEAKEAANVCKGSNDVLWRFE